MGFLVKPVTVYGCKMATGVKRCHWTRILLVLGRRVGGGWGLEGRRGWGWGWGEAGSGGVGGGPGGGGVGGMTL